MSASDRLRDELGEQSELEARPEPHASSEESKTNKESAFARANEVDTMEVLRYLGVDFEHRNDKTLATCPGCGEPGALVCSGGGLKCLHARCCNAGPRSHPGLRSNVDLVMTVRGHGDAAAALRELEERFDLRPAGNRTTGAGRSSASGDRPKQDPWPPPIPLDNVGELPPFPVDALPSWLADWVTEVATFTQTPPDLAACQSLAVLATALQQSVVVEVKPGYIEPLSLFLAVVMPPGERKSPVVRFATEPVLAHERECGEQLARARREATMHRDLLEMRLQAAKKNAVKTGDDAPAKELAHELAAHVVPVLPQYVVDDVTPERLAQLLAGQGGRIAILSAEGGAFAEIITGKRYGKGAPHLDLLLKGHDGDTVRIERVSMPPVCIDRPAITVGVAMQPVVLGDLAQHSGRGLPGRILMAVPRSLLGRRDADPPAISDATATEYAQQVRRLLLLGDEHREHPLRLSLDAEALALFHQLAASIEPELGPGGELVPFSDWATKIVGRTARLAALCYLADANGTDRGGIDAPAFAKASRMAAYFIEHAKAAYIGMGLDPSVNLARCMLDVLRRKGITEVTKRDLQQSVKGYRVTKETFPRALSLLVEHGWLRRKPAEYSGRGRPPGPVFAVHPATLIP